MTCAACDGTGVVVLYKRSTMIDRKLRVETETGPCLLCNASGKNTSPQTHVGTTPCS